MQVCMCVFVCRVCYVYGMFWAMCTDMLSWLVNNACEHVCVMLIAG